MMRKLNGRIDAFIAAILLALAGCGSGGNIAPVSGVVTLNGKPIADVAVSFQPIAGDGNNSPGPASYGVTDAEGRYSAKLIGEEKTGAAIGRNQVRFSYHAPTTDTSGEAVSKAKPAVKIPARYWSESEIELDVPPGGTTTADFQLKSP